MAGPQASLLPDGRRLHLLHGPIDLIIDATGPGRQAAFERAMARFDPILQELVDELEVLRMPAGQGRLRGIVARAMHHAVAPFASASYVTPMAAVAGAVADEVLRAMNGAGGLQTAYVNNGGDVALYLAPGTQMITAVAASERSRARITFEDPVRGVATSGWRGRSQSLGIADSVTVLARSAAVADAAATLIANAVDLPGHPQVNRAPATDLAPDSDLGDQLVTIDVGPLGSADIAKALDRGQAAAARYCRRGLISAALLTLGPQTRSFGSPNIVGPDIGASCHA